MSYVCKNYLALTGEGWQDFVNENAGKKGGIDFNLSYPLVGKSKMQRYKIWGSVLAMSGQGEWNKNKLKFYTMCFPPTAYFLEVSKKYPDVIFKLAYEEWTMDNYGIITIKNGKKKENLDIDNYFIKVHGFKEIKDVLRAIEDEFTIDLSLSDIKLLLLGCDETKITRYMRHASSVNWEEEWERYVEKHINKK